MNKKLVDIIFWSLVILSLIMFLWRVFGNSPTSDAIIYPLAIAITIKVINVGEDVSSIKIRFDNIDKRIENFDKDFRLLSNEFKEHIKNH
ncbi:MAG: hypothetical protein AABW52_04685 [Nanoarchaeota archaeon]